MPLIEPLIRSARLPLHRDSVVFGRTQLQFVATKVIPPQCTGLIDRQRLLDKISQLANKKLVVVKAPEGFGKTSFAVNFSDRLVKNGNALAWLTIDPDDDEPPCFLFDLSKAFQKGSNRVGSDGTDLMSE